MTALTRAFREQASNAARITRAEVTAELAERMEQDRYSGTLLAGTDPRKSRHQGVSTKKLDALIYRAARRRTRSMKFL